MKKQDNVLQDKKYLYLCQREVAQMRALQIIELT